MGRPVSRNAHFTINGYEALANVNNWSPIFRHDNSYTYVSNAAWTKGARNIRFGVDIARYTYEIWKALTALILETFRFNERLLAAGDRLTASLNLSSARWQVLGGIEQGPLPSPRLLAIWVSPGRAFSGLRTVWKGKE